MGFSQITLTKLNGSQ